MFGDLSFYRGPAFRCRCCFVMWLFWVGASFCLLFPRGKGALLLSILLVRSPKRPHVNVALVSWWSLAPQS